MKLRYLFLYLLIGFTSFVYLATIFLLNWIPCQNELLIGLCQLGKFVISAIGLLILFCYLFLVYFLGFRRDIRSSTQKLNSGIVQISLLSLVFLVLPVGIFFGPMRKDPALQPYSMTALQQNGKEQIEFLSFSDTPVERSQSTGKRGFLATNELRVKQSGTYSIHPIRPKGYSPAMVMTADQDRQASVKSQYLEAGRTYQFAYFVEILPGVESSPCDPVFWKILWQVESLPVYPLYLLGQGAFAQVYPDDSGEFAFVTHVNPEFRTKDYNICINDNQ